MCFCVIIRTRFFCCINMRSTNVIIFVIILISIVLYVLYNFSQYWIPAIKTNSEIPVTVAYNSFQKIRSNFTNNTGTPDELMARPIWWQRWQECPPSKGAGSVMVTVVQGGGLGNQVWEYLAVWGVARRYGLSPAVPRVNREKLLEVFVSDSLHIPILEELSVKCNLSWSNLSSLQSSVNVSRNDSEILSSLSLLGPGQALLLASYIQHAESAVPLWRDIPEELKLRPELLSHAERILTQVRDSIREQVLHKTGNSSLADLHSAQLQYVGVHVRRTDYRKYLLDKYPGARPASAYYFLNAMRWMRKNIKTPVAFLVLSDDLEWCRDELLVNTGEILSDVYIVGGPETLPRRGEDLAILGACNHSILSYGTFGLTGAALAQGGYTLVFDTQNRTNSFEMELVNRLPGWFAMDDAGRIRDEEVN